MGGPITLELALQQPELGDASILGCTGVLSAEKPRSPAPLRVLYYLPPWALRLLTPRQGADKGYGSAASPEAIAADQAVLAKDKFTVRGVVAQAAAIAGYATTAEAVAGLTMPALVLHGDEDGLVPLRLGSRAGRDPARQPLSQDRGRGAQLHRRRTGKGQPDRVLDFLREVDLLSERPLAPPRAAPRPIRSR